MCNALQEQRHQCEIDALVAVQSLEWPEESAIFFAKLPDLTLPPPPELLV